MRAAFRGLTIAVSLFAVFLVVSGAEAASFSVKRPTTTTAINTTLTDLVDDTRASAASSMLVGTYVENDAVYGDFATVAFSTFATARQLRTYKISASSPAWITTSNPTGIWQDDSGTFLRLPFRVFFWDLFYDYVWIGSNGYIQFPNAAGLKGQYYSGTNFNTLAMAQTDRRVFFDWGSGSPGGLVPADQFSVRWTGYLRTDFSETYTFITKTDDGVRLWIDGTLIIDRWQNQPLTTWTAQRYLSQGMHTIRMEYFENTGAAAAFLLWNGPSQTKGMDQPISMDNLYLDPTTRSIDPVLPFPSFPSQDNVVAAWWRLLDISKGGSITWASGLNYLAITWSGIPDELEGKKQTFQLQILVNPLPSTNTMRNSIFYVLWKSVTKPSTTIVVGVEDERGRRGVQYPTSNVKNNAAIVIYDDERELYIKSVTVTVTESDGYGYFQIDPYSRGGVNVRFINQALTAADFVASAASSVGQALLTNAGRVIAIGLGAGFLLLGTAVQYEQTERAIQDFLNDQTTFSDGVARVNTIGETPGSGGRYPALAGIGFKGLWIFTDHPFHDRDHSVTISVSYQYRIGSSEYTLQNTLIWTFERPGAVDWLDTFDNDCAISPWAVSKGSGATVEVRNTALAYSSPCALFISYGGSKGTGRATSPSITINPAADYTISTRFRVPSIQWLSDRYAVVLEDQRVVVDYSFGKLYYGLLFGRGPSAEIAAITLDAWHLVEIKVHPATTNYHVVVDGVQYGPYPFYASGTGMTISVGDSLYTGTKYCDAYWDNVRVTQ